MEEYQRRTRPRHQHPRKGPRSAEARPRDYLGRCSEGRAGLETGRRLGVWMLAGGGGSREGMVGRHIPTRVLSAPEGVMRLRCGYLPPSSPKPLLITNPCYTDMPTNLILFISFRFVTKGLRILLISSAASLSTHCKYHMMLSLIGLFKYCCRREMAAMFKINGLLYSPERRKRRLFCHPRAPSTS